MLLEIGTGEYEFNKTLIDNNKKFITDIAKEIPKFIQTNDFRADNIVAEYIDYDLSKNMLKFKITMSGIYLDTYVNNALFSIAIKYGFAAGASGALSATSTSEQFMINVPYDDGAPKIQLTNTSLKIVEGDKVVLGIIATDIAGVAMFDVKKEEFTFEGFSYRSVEISKNNKEYFVSIYDIKDEPGENIIKLPANIAMDYLGNYNQPVTLRLGEIKNDNMAPKIRNIKYSVNKDTTAKNIMTGDTLEITFDVYDDSNYILDFDTFGYKDYTEYGQNIVKNINFFDANYKDIKTVDGKTLNELTWAAGLKIYSEFNAELKSESKYMRVQLHLSPFPQITSEHFRLYIPEKLFTDSAGHSNISVIEEKGLKYIAPFEIKEKELIKRITAGRMDVKLTLKASHDIANRDELVVENLVGLENVKADNITINTTITPKNVLEITLENIKFDLANINNAKIIIKQGALKSNYNQELPIKDEKISLKDVLENAP